MKRLIYQVYVGSKTNLYDICVNSVENYCAKYDICHIVQREPILKIVPNMERSGRSMESVNKLGYLPIFEKENAFSYLEDYDQILILDSDIYIKQSAPNIFLDLPKDYSFGAVAEREMPCDKKYRSKITKYSKSAFRDLDDVNWKWDSSGAEFYNMGLMLVNCESFKIHLNGQTPREFINREEFRDFVDGVGYFKWSTDQMLLNWWIKKENVKVKNLDWRWNALYNGVSDLYLNYSFFVHFFLKDHLPSKGEHIEGILENL